jgi:alpha-glucosidase (family GH31 glycosyl hydrolase)
MELTEGSETSANHNLTPGKYPKAYTQQLACKLKKKILILDRSNMHGMQGNIIVEK